MVLFRKVFLKFFFFEKEKRYKRFKAFEKSTNTDWTAQIEYDDNESTEQTIGYFDDFNGVFMCEDFENWND
jgi:hypothetical protein